jgi:hypothetical protein
MTTRTLGMTLAALLVAGSSAVAGSTDKWQFEATPYLWATGMEGDMTVDGQTIEFDKKFSDIIDKVDMAFSALGVAQKGRFLVWAQGDYFSLSTQQFVTPHAPAGAKLETTLNIGELAVGWQVDGWSDKQTFDLLIGARFTRLESTLTVNTVGTFKNTRTLTDPMILVRPSIPILPSKIDGLRFNPTLGFGAGGDSKYVYEMQPQIQYQFTEHMAGRFGFRTVGYKVEKDGDEMNMRMSGLLIGLGFTW